MQFRAALITGFVMALSPAAFAQNVPSLQPVPSVAPQAAPAPAPSFAPSLLERQEMQAAEATAAQSVDQVKSVCGNPTFTFKYDWEAYEHVDYSAISSNTHRSEIMRMGSMPAVDIGNAMTQSCAADAMAKTDIGKITEVDLMPRNDGKNGFGIHFVLQGTVLHADYYPFARSGSQNVVMDLKRAL